MSAVAQPKGQALRRVAQPAPTETAKSKKKTVREIPLRRPLAEITADLHKPVPERLIRKRRQGGEVIPYISWHTANRILDRYAPGWEGTVVKIETTMERIFVTYRVTIHAQEGAFSREATGTELLKETDKNGNFREIAFGDPSSNAESMAFRRACARFGLGLHLYTKE